MEGYRFSLLQRVAWRDLDALQHVNNAVYASYLETGRVEYMANLDASLLGGFPVILADLQLSFKSPAFLREVLEIGVRVAAIRTSSLLFESEIREKESGRLVVTSKAVLVHYNFDAGRPTPVPAEWRERLAQFEGVAF